jgi:hypothetical protein
MDPQQNTLLESYNTETKQFILKEFNTLYTKSPQITLEMFIKDFAKDFDVSKLNHSGKNIIWKNHTMNIDLLLIDLFWILNKEELITTLSCQYNYRGYSFFCFSDLGFSTWISRLSRACVRYTKQSNLELSYDECVYIAFNLPILKRFRSGNNNSDNYLKLSCDWFCGNTELEVHISWFFLQNDISDIVSQLKEVFEADEKLSWFNPEF